MADFCAEQAKQVREFAREQGITHYYEVGCMGVEHALLPEQGVVGAGDLIIGADSHTCTYGALGAFSTGVGSTDAAVGYATGKAWFKVPETLLFKIDGELNPGVTGKDIILYIISRLTASGGTGYFIEFAGEAIPVAGALQGALNAGRGHLKALIGNVLHREEVGELIAHAFAVLKRDAAFGGGVDRHADKASGKALEFDELIAHAFDGTFNELVKRSGLGH